ncbi:biotin-dependent carboxyltransferase family protein [Cnuibacter sp. UC19_7]|uniref:5-oxoprolinase subunit C family protein n=1 Tax=Cnuibacter sp. UC19_7 TaxID=3350166 RepID=UPI0036732C56
MRDGAGAPALEVLSPGPLALLQDHGRPGYAHLGVTESGAADLGAFDAANRLVGNLPGALVVETLLGGWRMRALRTVRVAVAGASVSVLVSRDGRTVEHPVGCALTLEAGDELEFGAPPQELRSYLAVRDGIAAPLVLGSGSSDTLSGLGPPPLRAGDILKLASQSGPWPAADMIATWIGRVRAEIAVLPALLGPRDHLLSGEGLTALGSTTWTVSQDSNRVGVRLSGPPLEVVGDAGQLPSEGVVAGSVQLPPDGRPVLFLRDHPVTGGYPVVAVLTRAAQDAAAQLRPGDRVRLAPARR